MYSRSNLRAGVVLTLALLAGLLGCGGGSSAAPTAQSSSVMVQISAEQSLQTVRRPQSFKASVTGTGNPAVQWSVASGGGSIDAAGVYTAPDNPGIVVVKATSVADPTRFSTQAVTVVAAPTISGFTTSKAVVPYGGSALLVPAFNTDGTATITPSVTAAAITSGASYSVSPSAITSYTLSVTNSAGTTLAATVTVDVLTAQVSIAPAQTVLTVSTTQQFNAVVGGAVNTGVSWSATGGSISSSGLFTAPATPGSYAVMATSSADGSKSVLASVKVVAAPSITLFQALKTPITKGYGTALVFAFSGGQGSIDQGVGPVVTTGNANVGPDITTRYTLSVTNEAGTTKLGALLLTVIPAPDATLTLGGCTDNGSILSGTTGLTASVPVQSGCTYAWSITGYGAISSGATTNAVVFKSGDGGSTLGLKCVVTNAAGDTASSTANFKTQRHWQPLVPGPAVGTMSNSSISLAVDDSTTLWMAWRQIIPATSFHGIYVSRRVSGTWSAPLRVDNLSGGGLYDFGWDCRIASDNHGHAMVLWTQASSVGALNVQLYSAYFNGTAWQAPVRIDTESSAEAVVNPRIGLDATGNAVVIWQQYPIATPGSITLLGSHSTAGVWSTPVVVDGYGTPTLQVGYNQLDLAVDPGGSAVAVWNQVNGAGSKAYCSVFSGGSWGYFTVLSSNYIPSSFTSSSVQAAADLQGTATLAFGDFDGTLPTLVTRRMALGGGLDGFDNLAVSGSGTRYPYLGSLSVAPGGLATLTYDVLGGTDNTTWFGTLDPVSGSWGNRNTLGNYGAFNRNATAAINPSGDICMAWMANATDRTLLVQSIDGITGQWNAAQRLAPSLTSSYENHVIERAPTGPFSILAAAFQDPAQHIYTSTYR